MHSTRICVPNRKWYIFEVFLSIWSQLSETSWALEVTLVDSSRQLCAKHFNLIWTFALCPKRFLEIHSIIIEAKHFISFENTFRGVDKTASQIPFIYWKFLFYLVLSVEWAYLIKNAVSTEQSMEHQVWCIASIRLCHINFVKMNSHKHKMHSKTFRNVFFNCHHFIRFRFVSFGNSMVLGLSAECECIWVDIVRYMRQAK